MKRFLACLAILVLASLAQVSDAAWWGWWQSQYADSLNQGLTFHAPFDDPANPLKLYKGTGALTFTRATPATFVHPTTGLVTTAGNNLLVQSEDFGTTWAKQNTLVSTNTSLAPDGTLTADTITDNATSSYHRIYSSTFSFVSGTSYTASVYVKEGTSNFVQIAFHSTYFGTNAWANFDVTNGATAYGTVGAAATAYISDAGGGWYRCSITAPATESGIEAVYIYHTDDTNSTKAYSYVGSGKTFYLWGAQLSPAYGGTTPGSYVKTTTAAASALRIESNGALIEGQRTNLALQSEAMGLAATWTATNITVDNNTAVAPDGATTAETLTATADSADISQSIATDNSASYTFSVYLKRKTGTGAVSLHADNTTLVACTINASTWTRCTATNGMTDNTANHSPGIRIATNGDAVYVFGGGMEKASFSSSYIPTTTAPVTRNADVLTFPTSGNVSGTVGTAAAQVDAVGIGATKYVLAFTDSMPFILHSSAKFGSYDGVGSSYPTGTVADGSPNKVGVWWGGSYRNVALNGTAYSQASFDGEFNIGGTGLAEIGSTTAGTSHLFGHIKNLRIWNRAFTDAELQSITR